MIRAIIVWLLTIPFSNTPVKRQFEVSVEPPAAQEESFKTWQDSLKVIANL